ncbi:amidohydrolase [Rubripirellula amarantea]|nr:amidohydrolase [Rubripirellula amarantea]
MIKLNRRQLLGVSAAAAASAAIPKRHSLVADEVGLSDPDTPAWIDAHVHVWTPDTSKYPLSPRFGRSDMQPASFTPDELFSHCRPAGVARVVLIQMSFYEYDNTYMIDVMRKHPGVFSGVGIVDHNASDLAERVTSLASQGVRGFRLHSRSGAKGWSNNSGMKTLWRLAAEQGLAICPLINPTDIPYVDELCSQFPDTTVVVDHFARIGVSGTIEQESLDQLCRLSRFPKTHVKTSAFYALGRKQPPYTDLVPMIRRVVDQFGPERLMWASDCPYQVQGDHTYDASIGLIRDEISFLSESDKQWMLRDTAAKVFF